MISIIIPTYNRASYLVNCIKSILNQTYKDFEIIVIDDGSTDNTFEVIAKLKDKRIRYYNEGRVGNISMLRNTGIKLSNYEIIAFCDDDDMWVEDKLEKQIPYLNKYGLICSNANVIDKNNNFIGKTFHEEIDYSFEIKPEKLLSKNYVITSSVILTKNILPNRFPFDSKIMKSSSEDYDLWLSLLIKKCIRMYFINSPLVYYRIHDNLTYQRNNLPVVYINSVGAVSKYLNYPNLQIRKSACMGRLKFKLELSRLYLNYKQPVKFLKIVSSILMDMRKKYFLLAAINKLKNRF